MDLILAMDLMKGQVVHGQKGERNTYRPLVWGISPSTEPVEYVRFLRPRFLYIADLDHIQGTGSHIRAIYECAREVTKCYVDRGCRSPDDYLSNPSITNVVGTETAGSDLTLYHGGFLSLDMREGRVVPSGEDPVQLLTELDTLDFEGVILLNIGAVGTGTIPPLTDLKSWRGAFKGTLFYGGGVGREKDLYLLYRLGYEGVLISTSLHRGLIPLSFFREGYLC
ncbi:MAG: nickel transporter [Methanomicrobiales archaeon]|nr:nickel transporter [Methanomicrobiales archaeon]